MNLEIHGRTIEPIQKDGFEQSDGSLVYMFRGTMKGDEGSKMAVSTLRKKGYSARRFRRLVSFAGIKVKVIAVVAKDV